MDGLPSDWRVVEPPASAAPNTPGSKPPATEASRIWTGVLVTGVVALVIAGAWMLSGPTDATVAVDVAALDVAVSRPPDRAVAGPSMSAETVEVLVVDVGGAVRRPGVYRLPPDSRVMDAITAAGGFGPSVDTSAAARDLNLASPLQDGERIRVPARGGATLAPGSGGGAGTAASTDAGDGLVDLNTASASELEALPAIGPATAAKIIAAREEQRFTSVDELRSRKILGEAALGKVRDLVTVR